MANPTNITCWEFDATPQNVILHPINSLDLEVPTIVYLARVGMMSTFPSTSDVKDGTKYGPTGTEYIGVMGGGSATFPLTGDVDLGIIYGPAGSDYTGTLVQPIEGDVKSGVNYGAGGTEFTGTYAGGGSGSSGFAILGG